MKTRELLVASRPFSWPNTPLPFLAAALSWKLSLSWEMLVGFVYFLLPYNLLLYGVSDLFNYESDRRNPREGRASRAGCCRPGPIGLWPPGSRSPPGCRWAGSGGREGRGSPCLFWWPRPWRPPTRPLPCAPR